MQTKWGQEQMTLTKTKWSRWRERPERWGWLKAVRWTNIFQWTNIFHSGQKFIWPVVKRTKVLWWRTLLVCSGGRPTHVTVSTWQWGPWANSASLRQPETGSWPLIVGHSNWLLIVSHATHSWWLQLLAHSWPLIFMFRNEIHHMQHTHISCLLLDEVHPAWWCLTYCRSAVHLGEAHNYEWPTMSGS